MPEYVYGGKNTQTFQRLPGYKKLAAWQAASDLSHLVGQAARKFGPGNYRLSDQMRGAGMSAAANIAEGYASGTLANYIRYCNHARGSLSELGSYLQDCERAGMLAGDELAALLKQFAQATWFLDRLLQGLAKKEHDGTWDNSYWVKEPPAEYAVSADAQQADEDLSPPID